MKKKIKLVTILGTRPEIIRLSHIIKEIDNDNEFEHILVHTGQNYDYELNQIFFDELELRQPDYYLSCAGSDLGETIGNVFAKSYELLKELKPDAVMILGDTNSSLAAISAKRLKLPIFHLEAGNRCGDWNVPETINRKIVDHTSDINLCYTHYAYDNLIKEGLNERYLHIIGSPMNEVLSFNNDKINQSNILDELELEPRKYIVLSMHREENIDIDKNLNMLIESINLIADKYQLPIIFSTHPRTRKKIEEKKITLHPLIKSIKPLGFIDYVKLQENAFIVLSDSGTLTEESYMRKFPAVLIRTSTERLEGIEAGSIVMSGIDKDGILLGIDTELMRYKFRNIISDYEITDTSKKVIDIIKNNIDIVNKEIWKK